MPVEGSEPVHALYDLRKDALVRGQFYLDAVGSIHREREAAVRQFFQKRVRVGRQRRVGRADGFDRQHIAVAVEYVRNADADFRVLIFAVRMRRSVQINIFHIVVGLDGIFFFFARKVGLEREAALSFQIERILRGFRGDLMRQIERHTHFFARRAHFIGKVCAQRHPRLPAFRLRIAQQFLRVYRVERGLQFGFGRLRIISFDDARPLPFAAARENRERADE